ncbi:lysoplasmalogenase family protein [Erythrobacter crassostreae]|uniref:Lysoplasmalogenase n=1 Tax=Erythrobacter crassostreae TaxID=2828328 RepID=A0A9X1F517_9SPHN|nr:lysoplasmalogenase family protein [Erythrobacter crassostrea]MBV7260267.1 lysoplasmalogenase [Erythrobacter crassostrea]
MAKNALIEHRPWLLASVVAACAYYFLWNNPIGELYLIILKGSAVGLLALYAWRRTHGGDGLILVAVLALSAAADMALVLDITIGGALFALSHVAAIALYLRNRRNRTTSSQKLLAAALFIGAPVISYLLSQDILIAVYAVSLGGMAAAAWLSRFPRYRVGVGAVLFVISDWLIFSQTGPFDLSPVPNMLIWPLYYSGQLMIATGVVQTLRGEKPAY